MFVKSRRRSTFLPNVEPKRFFPMASTLIYGGKDAC